MIPARQLWCAVFGNDRPVEIEIGPGRGEMLLGYGAASPTTNYLAIERSGPRAERLAARAEGHGLTNVRVLVGDARAIIGDFVPPNSVSAYHVYFPDPWPKRRHGFRRLFDDGRLAAALARTLIPGGLVDVATDVASLFAAMCRELTAAGLVRDADATPPRRRPTTSFERRYAGGAPHLARFVRR